MNDEIRRIFFDRETSKWMNQHPYVETTVALCDECRLYYKPELGHKCKVKGGRGHAAD